MPRDMDDTEAQCPGYQSIGPSSDTDGSKALVTVLTYQIYKFRLYQATSSLTREIYGRKNLSRAELIAHIELINHRLVEIWESVPPELRLSGFKKHDLHSGSLGIERVFRLQALALQLLYDNLQLILHRPLLQYEITTPDLSAPAWETSTPASNSPLRPSNPETREAAQRESRVIAASRNRMWESGMRTSWLAEQQHTLSMAANTHAATYVSIQSFTAGVTLGLFAISSPFSRQSQMAKQAIGRLIRAPKSLGYSTTASEQYSLILRDLIQLVFKAEMKCLESGQNGVGLDGHGSEQELQQSDVSRDSPLLRLSSPHHPRVGHVQGASEDLRQPQRMTENNTNRENSAPLHILPVNQDQQRQHLEPLNWLADDTHGTLLNDSDLTQDVPPGWTSAAHLNDTLASLQQHGT